MKQWILIIFGTLFLTGCTESAPDRLGEKIGRTLSGFSSGLNRGLGIKPPRDSAVGIVKKAGEAAGAAVTGFTTGLQKSPAAVVELSAALKNSGVSHTVASVSSGGIPGRQPVKKMVVYLLASQTYNATVCARAINSAHQEIGRSLASVSIGAGDANYVTFVFAPEMDINAVERFEIDGK